MRYPHTAAVRRADHHLLAALRRCGADPLVGGAARGLSWAGEHGAVWLAAGLAGAGADRPRRRAWLRATALVATSHAASMVVKRVVRRPRPPVTALVRTAGRHSFPSSHAASATAAAIAFGALLPRGALSAVVLPSTLSSVLPSAPSPVPSPALAMVPRIIPPLAAAMCVSRLVVGVHYPTDVACGALLGGAMARLGRGWALAGVRDD